MDLYIGELMTTFLQILESFYYVSNMALLVVAVIGLKQLKISRESLRINATRESLMCANSQIQYYLNEVIKDLLIN